MKNKMACPALKYEYSIALAYSDIEIVAEIDRYYLNLMSVLRKSDRLSEEEKTGQRAFLHQQWEYDLDPFLSLWSVKSYACSQK